ncbi:MAG: replication protein [Thiomicrorhabdus sp.]|nr:replication protein [Thiomicrorhabdus sp.]
MSKFIPNSFQVPNIIIDEYMAAMSASAFKCYMLIIRKTKGWNKSKDGLAYSQFHEGTGINGRATIRKALDELIACGLVKQQSSKGNYSTFSVSFTRSEIEHVNPLGSSEIEHLPVQKLNTQTNTIQNTTKQTNTNTKGCSEDSLSPFEKWWKLFPKKIAKSEAEKVWKRKKLDLQSDEIIADIDNRNTKQYSKTDKQFIPNPATFLNQERWNDEIIVQSNQPTPISKHSGFASRDYSVGASDASIVEKW